MGRKWNPFISDRPVEDDPNHRRHGRLNTQDISCSLGDIINLSASGMRVGSARAVPQIGSPFTMVIEWSDGRLALSCVVRWIRRTGLLKREVGVEFVDLTDQQRRSLGEIARSTAQNETIRPDVMRYRDLIRAEAEAARAAAEEAKARKAKAANANRDAAEGPRTDAA